MGGIPLICHKKAFIKYNPSEFFAIFAVTIKQRKELLMSTKKETKDERVKIDSQKVETSSQKPMPSIWYN